MQMKAKKTIGDYTNPYSPVCQKKAGIGGWDLGLFPNFLKIRSKSNMVLTIMNLLLKV